MVGESGGDRGDIGGGGGGERARCVRCDLEYNRDDRCPRVLVCGHTCCSACLDHLITEGQKRCPTCSRPFFSLSVVLIPKNLEVLSGAEKSSGSSVSSYRSPFTSSSSTSSFEVTKISEKSSQSLKSSYSSPLRSSLSSNLDVLKNSEESSSYSSPSRLSSSHDSSLKVTDGFEKSSLSLQTTSESLKSSQSFQSFYTSTLRSYSSVDSSLERSATATERSSVSSSLKSSSFLGSSLGVKESEGSLRSNDVSESSSSVLSPPPIPSSAPPSLQEYDSGLLTSEVRSQGGTGVSEVDGGGRSGSLQDLNSEGDRSEGGSGGGGSGTRPSNLNRSSSADQTSGGSYAPPTYSFPTIRTKLNINGFRKQENDASSSSFNSGKTELRPTKSLPPSSFPSSSPKKEEEGLSSVPSSSGYTSPFLKSSTSSSSSFLKTNTFRSLSSEPQKLSSRNTAATDSEKETKSKTLSSAPSPFRTSTFRTMSSEAQALSSKNTVATDSEKEAKNKTLSSAPSPFRTMSSDAQKPSSKDTAATDSEKETKNKTLTSTPSPFRTSTFRTLSSDAQKLSSKDTVATDSEKETKSKTLSSAPSPFRTSTFRTLSSDALKQSSKDTAATDSEKETKNKTLSSSPSPFRTNTFRSLSSEPQKLSSKDNAATDSEKETTSKTLSSTPSPFKTSTFRPMSSDAQKPSLKDTVATDSEKETKNKTLSSAPSPFRTSTFRTVSSDAQKLSSRDTAATDSQKETNNKTATSSTYSSLSSSSFSSTDGSSRSRSLPSLHKLDAKLSVPPAALQKDEVDLGVSRWKMQTPSSLSRKTDAKDAASLRSEAQNSSSSKASGTPSHVLRMIRSVATKTRSADDATVTNKADEATTSQSFREDATTASSSSFSSSSSSSSFSSSLTTSNDLNTRHESRQFGQEGASNQQMSQTSAASEAPPAGSATPRESDRPSDSVSLLTSPGSDSGEGDASEGRGGVPVLGGEADEAARHVPAAAPPTGSRGEESKGSRKLAHSSSLSARLGARTRFLAATIDEASEEEEHVWGGKSSAGERQARAGRGDKLYTPDRQGVQQQQQPTRNRVSLGARISARASYLSGGWGEAGGGASRGEVQAEDSTKIDLQRRAGRAGTKDEAAEEGRDGTPGETHGAAGAHLATAGDDATRGVEATPGSAGPTQSRRPSTSRIVPDPEGDGTRPAVATSGRRDPSGVRGSAAPTHESSQHTQWRRHRPIDSRAKEELSDAGCGSRAASDHSLGSTSTGLPEAPEGGAFTSEVPPEAGSTTTAAATSALSQKEAAAAPHRHQHEWTKHNDTSDGTPPVFRSEAGSVIDTSGAAEGASGTGGGQEGGKTGTPPPPPSSGPYPWRKKWRSVTEHTSSAAARHTPPGANNTALSGTSKQPEQQPPPHSPLPLGEAPGRSGGSEGSITASYRASLGTLAIGRVPSVQEPDGDGGTDGDKTARRGRAPDASKTGSWQATEDTSEDVNTRLRRARERLRATTTTPTEEEPPPSPARTNLSYLLTRVQSSEAMARATRKTVLSDDDDEVFEDSEDEVDDDKHPKPPNTSPSDSLDGELEANMLQNSNPPTGSIQGIGRLHEVTTDEVDSVTRRRSHHNDRKEEDREGGAQEELYRTVSQNSEATRQSELNSITQLQNSDATEPLEVNDTRQQQDLEATRQTDQHYQDEARDAHEDATDAPYEAPPGYFGVDETDEGEYESAEGEYEPGVGLCSSHGQMLDRYCQDCEEWVCMDCLRVLHRPKPEGSCTIISAAEGVNQIKISHSSFLTSRSNTLEYFRAELRRIIEECNSSINLHKDNIRHLESKIEEERRLLRGIKSMKNLSKEKMKHVNYWEDVLQDNLSRLDESSTSQDVLRVVQESSGDILHKAMEAVSLEASAGVLLAPPN